MNPRRFCFCFTLPGPTFHMFENTQERISKCQNRHDVGQLVFQTRTTNCPGGPRGPHLLVKDSRGDISCSYIANGYLDLGSSGHPFGVVWTSIIKGPDYGHQSF